MHCVHSECHESRDPFDDDGQVNGEGFLPLHVAIENIKSLSPELSHSSLKALTSCVDGLLMADPSALATKERRHGLCPFVLVTVGDKSQVNTVCHLLRRDPSVLTKALPVLNASIN